MIAQEAVILNTRTTCMPTVRRAVVFAPHPDDEVFGCGGTLALLREQGAAVSVIILTDGAAGGVNIDGALQKVRRDESRAAARILGISEPVFWDYPDRGLAYGEELIERLLAALRAEEADLVFLPSPTELHPDHQVVGFAGAEALRRLGDQLQAAFYEINHPLPNPNLYINISQVAGQKMAAMRCFPSQLQEQPYDLRIEGLNRFRSFFMGAEVASAEAFVLVEVHALMPGLMPLFEGPLAHRQRLGFPVSGADIPLVSIIVRSMNRATLSRALDALALQTWPHLEVVVVNARGGAHTPLPDQCGRFPLRLLNQRGAPLPRSLAANTGLAACRGTYLGFLDDDDAIDPDHIQHLVEALQASPMPVIVYAGVRSANNVSNKNQSEKVFKTSDVTFGKLLLGNVIPIHAILFPASLLEQGTRFDEALDLYEDWDFWLQLCRHTPFQLVDRVSATYHTGGESAVSPLEHDPDQVRQATSILFAKWLKLLTPEELKAVADLYHRAFNELQGLRHEAAHHYNLLQHTKRQLHYTEKDLEGSERQRAELERQRAELERQLAVQQQELAMLYASRSWWLTRPVRWGGRRLREVAGILKKFWQWLPVPPGLRRQLRKLYRRNLTLGPVVSQEGGPWPDGLAGQILLIERSVPRPNQDAGSMMILNFIQVLIELGYGVTLYPVDLLYDPSYTPRLEQMGVRCLHRPLVDTLEQHLMVGGPEYDVILACRPDYSDAMIPVLRQYCPQARILYETHDLHFVREQRQAELEQNAQLLAHSRWRKKQELHIAERVDCTLVVSEQERTTLLQENPDLYVEVIPVIGEVFGCGAGFGDRRDLLFIGGYEHRPNVDAVVHFAENILPLILAKLPAIRFYVVGSHPPAEITDLASDTIKILGFVPDISDLMNSIRISVNPLRFGAGVKGKLVTCMSYGIPCIGTTVAVEGMSLIDNRHVLVADTPRDFADAVVRLYTDQTLWERLSSEGLAFMQEHFSLDTARARFCTIFSKLCPELEPAPLEVELIDS